MIDYDIASYKPTGLQMMTKIKLHQYVNPQVLGTLNISNLQRIRHYLYPVEIEDVYAWCAADPVFWFWFIMPNEQAARLANMRSQAVDVVQGILNGTEEDSKMAGVRLKAAQMLLSLSDKPQTQVTKNTMQVTGTMEIPKELAKKSVAEIQSEINRLNMLNSPDEEN